MTLHSINSGRGDKKIGKAYNDTIKHFPDEDWVLVTDQDAWLWPELADKQIEDVIEKHGHEYNLLGCMTNRVAYGIQKPFKQDFDNMDVFHHRKRALELYEKNYGQVQEINSPIAGVFMLFPKTFWNDNPFNEKVHYADTEFSKHAIRSAKKIGLCTGIYTFHWYRADKNFRDNKHLFV